jgi:hypothetical protein
MSVLILIFVSARPPYVFRPALRNGNRTHQQRNWTAVSLPLWPMHRGTLVHNKQCNETFVIARARVAFQQSSTTFRSLSRAATSSASQGSTMSHVLSYDEQCVFE